MEVGIRSLITVTVLHCPSSTLSLRRVSLSKVSIGVWRMGGSVEPCACSSALHISTTNICFTFSQANPFLASPIWTSSSLPLCHCSVLSKHSK